MRVTSQDPNGVLFAAAVPARVPLCEYLISSNYSSVEFSDGPCPCPPAIYYTFEKENLPVTPYGLTISSHDFHSQFEEGLRKLGHKIELQNCKYKQGSPMQHWKGVIEVTYELNKIDKAAIEQVLVDVVIGAIKKAKPGHAFNNPTQPYRNFIWDTYLKDCFHAEEVSFSFFDFDLQFKSVEDSSEPAG